MASKKKQVAPRALSSFDELDAAGFGAGYRPAFTAIEAAAPEQPAEERGFLGAAKDTGISLLKGAIGVPESAVGLADLVTGGRAGQAAEAIGFRPREAKAMLEEAYSAPQKEAFRRVQAAQGFGDTMFAAVTNPSVVAHSVVESLPLMGAGGLIGRGVAALAPRVSGTLAGAMGEGVVGAGSAAETIRQQTADGTLDARQAALAAGTGVLTTGFGLLGGKLAKQLGFADPDTMIAAAARDQAATRSLTQRVLGGALTEGVFEELPQSVQEQVLQNMALNKPLDEGVNQAAVLGMLSGAAMGGGANLIASSGPMPNADAQSPGQSPGQSPAPAPAQAPAQEPAPEPKGPLSRAANAMPVAASMGMQQPQEDAPQQAYSPGEPIEGANIAALLGSGMNRDPLQGAMARQRDEQAAQQTLASWMERAAPMPLEQAQKLQSAAAEKTASEMSVVPHSSGSGFTVVPSQWVTPDMRAKVPAALPNNLTSQPETPYVGNTNAVEPVAPADGGQRGDVAGAGSGNPVDPGGNAERGLGGPAAAPSGASVASPTVPDANGKPVAPVAKKPTPAQSTAAAGESWTMADATARDAMLREAGWKPASPGTEKMKTQAWDKMTQGQRNRLAKVIEAGAKVEGQTGGEQGRKNTDESITHAGLKIRVERVKVGDSVSSKWVVQSPENAERDANGARQIGGDLIVDTREQAIKTAEQEAKRYAAEKVDRAKREAEEKASRDAAEAKKEVNRGKTIAERRADAMLDKQVRDAATGEVVTRRAWVERAIAQGRVFVEEQVPDGAAKKRDQDAVAAVGRAGYILGASNENIPVVKKGLEAAGRLKDGKYQKPEYRAYKSDDRSGSFTEVTKIEYDYAQRVRAAKAAEASGPPKEQPFSGLISDDEGKALDARHAAIDAKLDAMSDDEVRSVYAKANLAGANRSVDQLLKTLKQEHPDDIEPLLAAPATHQDPGEKAEPVTKAVVAESIKKAAMNEGAKPSAMRAWLLGEIDKAMQQAPDRADFDEAVKRLGEKDAVSLYIGEGFFGKNAETGFLTFDVPGDGKFKVRNSMRGLLEFRKKVNASLGFKDAGQNTAKPEEVDGVHRGSGGKLAAVLNMIEEGDFEAARDYAEAVGIKLEDVKVPRGERKPQWDQFLKDGTLPPAAWMPSKEWEFADIGASSFVPDSEKRSATLTRVADGSTYVATVKGNLEGTSASYTVTKDGKEIGRTSSRRPFSETLRMAEDAMPEANDKPAPSKAKDTGWNMSGTGYGGKRYIGRNIITEDGREIVGRVYENAGTYEEAEVKVDGVRKFTVRDSYNAQDKADAFVKTLIEGEQEADDTAAQQDAPAASQKMAEVPEGYKPAGEPFYRGGRLTQGYAPFAPGERVTMKDAAGQSGVVESFASPDDAGVFASAVVKFDNGVEQMVPLGKLQAAAAPAQTQATGTRRDPTKVSMFNPYEDGDIVTIDGQDWTVKQDTPGWYLTNTGNWRGTHPTIRNIKAMADLIRAVEQAAVAQPKATEPEAKTPRLTPAEATELMEWQSLGTKDGVTKHILTFYESKADKDAHRGRMTMATVSKGERSATAWTIDGDDKRFGTLGLAKKRGMEVGMAKAKADGFVQMSALEQALGADVMSRPVDKAAKLRKDADKLAAEARKMLEGIEPGQPIMSARDRNLRERSMEKMRKAAELNAQADALEAAKPKATDGAEAPAQQEPRQASEFNAQAAWDAMTPAARGAMLDKWAGAGQTDMGERYKSRAWGSFNAGEKGTLAAVLKAAQEPATDDRDTFTLKRLNRETGRMEPVTFKRGEYVEVTLIGSDKKDYGEIDGISQARREFSVNGLWHTMGAAYKAERPAAPVRKDMAPLSSVIDKMNAKNGEGLTEADRVPEQKPASKTPTVDRHEAMMKSVREGKATAEQFKAAFESLVANKDAVLAELETKTKAELLKAGGYFIQMRYASEKKGEVIDAIYRQMVSGFVLGDTLSYGMGKGAFEAAVRRHVEATDDAKLEQYAKDRQAAIAEAQAERAAKAAAMDNPQTLADFKAIIAKHIGEGKSAKEAFLSLTPEQRIKYDTLAAESTKEARDARKRAAKTEVRAAGQATGGEIIATKHTRDGYDLFVVKLADRLSKEDYNTVLASAKRLGGWYSSFRGNGAIPGFQFKDKANAEAFLKLAAGDTSAAKEQVQQRRNEFEDDRSQTAAERLGEMADSLESKAQEELTRDRKANTERRARFAASALNAAEAQKALAKTMRNIAAAIEAGKAKFLDAVRAKTQVEMLTGYVRTAKDNELRSKYPAYADQEKRKGEPATAETADFAEFPTYSAYRSDFASLARRMLEVEGTKKLGQQLMSVADDMSDAYTAFAKENLLKVSAFTTNAGLADFASKEQAERSIKASGLTGKAIVLQVKRGQNRIVLSPSEAITRGIWQGDDKRITLTPAYGAELVQAIGRRGNKANKLEVPWQLQTAHDRREALKRIGIETPSEFRSALREFIGLQELAARNKVREMELAMVGKKNDGLDFFPTPEEVADQMVDAADIKPEMSVLEPSAGMGHIAERIQDAGVTPDVAEISSERRELLEEKGFDVVGWDFLDLKGEKQYDRIIMNPPFSNRRDAEHVRHAYTLLKPGGRIVAIMGEGVFFGQDKKAQEFRDWLDEVGGTSEKLPEGSFMDKSLPVNTGVNARMVVIDKAGRAGVDGDAPALGRNDLSDTLKRAMEARQTGMRLADAKAAVDEVTAKWDGGPDVNVVASVYDLRSKANINAPEDARGVYFRGSVWLVAGNNQDRTQLLTTLAHESVAHYGLREMLGADAWSVLMGNINTATENGNKAMQAIREDLRRIYVDDDGNYNLSKNKEADEIAARVVEMAVDPQTGEFRPGFGFVKSVYARIAQFLRDLGLDIKFTMTELQGMLVRAQGEIQNGKGRGLLVFSGEPLFQRVWHGSPYRFSKFDSSKMGTGEGAQAYGWGHYFASKKEIAEYYREQLSAGLRGWDYARRAKELGIEDFESFRAAFHAHADSDAPVGVAAKRIAYSSSSARSVDGAALSRLITLFRKEKQGQLYEVNIPEDDELLLWDKPLSEQPNGVKSAISAYAPPSVEARIKDGFDRDEAEMDYKKEKRIFDKMLGKDFYGQSLPKNLAKERSLELASLGIKGIKYLDGTSRSAGEGTYNYVIFDDADAEIVGTAFSRQDQIRNELAKTSGAVDAGSNSALDNLNKVMERAGWEIAFVDMDLTTERPTASIRINRYDGRFLIAKVDSIGRATIETFQRERSLRMDGSTKGRRPLSPMVDDVFLGRQRFEGARAMLRGMTNYLTDNALSQIALSDMRAAWGAVMNGPVHKDATQLESPGNQGTFDPKNNDIRFARGEAGNTLSTTSTLRAKIMEAMNDTFNVPGKLNWWHKTVGTQYNLAKRSPQFKRVFDGVQAFLSDVSLYATEAADLAPRLLPKLETWRDIAKTPISPQDNKAVAAPIFEGTLLWTRDGDGKPVKVADLEAEAAKMTTEDKARALLRSGHLDQKVLKMWQGHEVDRFEAMVSSAYERAMLQPGVVWTKRELKTHFGLTSDQVGLYKEFRKSVDRSLTHLTVSDMLRLGGEDVQDVRQKAIDAPDVEAASAILRDHLLELAGQQPDRNDVLTDTANRMIDKADRARDLMQRGYAPLSRFGHYTLDVVAADGERVYFGLFESAREAARMGRKMQANFPKAKVTRGTVSEEEYKVFAGVSPETVELFGEMLGLEAQGDGAANKAFQEYLKVSKSSRSAMKRLIERKGIAGFSEDVGRVLAGFVYSNARQTSQNLHFGEVTDAVNEVNKVDKVHGELKDAAVRLFEYVKNPHEEAQAFRGLLFAQYLGGSLASAMVNMLQPVQVTFPYLSQFGGAAKAAKRMKQAFADVKNGKTGDKELDDALKKAEEEGIVAPQEVHQLMAQSQGRGVLKPGDGTTAGDAAAKASNARSRISLAWGKVFGVAEQLNRRVTFIAAYRTAVEQGMENPAAFAENAVNETQFIYNKGNKPQWARGAVGSTLFTFKQYSVSYVELLHRMATQNGPEGRKAALLALGMLFLMAGAGGMPFAEDVQDLVDGVMQRLGYNFNSKLAKRQFFERVLGKDFGRFVEHGLSGLPGMPLDVSGRLGLGNLIPGTGLLVDKADHTRDVVEFAGVAGDFATRLAKGANQLAQGNAWDAAKQVMPRAAFNLEKAREMATTGQYKDDRGRKVIDVDGFDALVKAIGFQPTDVARVQEATGLQQRLIAGLKQAESRFAERWAQAVADGKTEELAQVRADIVAYNQRNPDTPVRINRSQIAKRVQAIRSGKAERVAKTAPKEIRGQVRQALAEVE